MQYVTPAPRSARPTQAPLRVQLVGDTGPRAVRPTRRHWYSECSHDQKCPTSTFALLTSRPAARTSTESTGDAHRLEPPETIDHRLPATTALG